MMNETFDINNEVLLGRFFEQQRRKNLVILRTRYSLSEDAAVDVYQDSCIALFYNIKDGKLVGLSSSLSTYFTRICINLALKKIREARKDIDSIDDDSNYASEKIHQLLDYEDGLSEDEIEAMHSIVAMLPPPCEQIIWAYYRDNMSMAEIAKLVGYRNAETAKAKKSQCLSKLIKHFKERLKKAIYGK